jgi:hypothetical protein
MPQAVVTLQAYSRELTVGRYRAGSRDRRNGSNGSDNARTSVARAIMKMEPEEEMYLSENSLLKFLVAERNARECWVNDIYQDRSQSELHKLFDKLCLQPTRFYEYYRMSLNTYQYILNAIEEAIKKQSNFRDCISPSERLTVALK